MKSPTEMHPAFQLIHEAYQRHVASSMPPADEPEAVDGKAEEADEKPSTSGPYSPAMVEVAAKFLHHHLNSTNGPIATFPGGGSGGMTSAPYIAAGTNAAPSGGGKAY